MDSKTVEQIVKYSDEIVPANYPIDNEWLRREPGIRNTYFKVLTAILQQRDQVSRNQAGIFTRLLTGALGRSAEGFNLDDYLALNTNLEMNEYSRFISAIKDLPAKYRMVVDMIVIACSDGENDQQLALAAVIMDALMITERESELLCRVGKSIITQDSAMLWSVEENYPDLIDLELFAPYFQYYLEDVHDDNADTLTVKLGTKKDLMLPSVLSGSAVTNRNVKIKNAVINLSAGSLTFAGNDSISLINCDFVNGMNPISFIDVDSVNIVNCHFVDFRSRVIYEDRVRAFHIEECNFDNCYLHYDSKSNYELGAVIYTPAKDRNATNVIESCNFSDCGCINSRVYEASAVISNCNSIVRNCDFRTCWVYCAADRPRKEKRSTSTNNYMFLLGTVNNNNRVRDSMGFSAMFK